MASKQDLLQAIKNRQSLANQYPSLTEKERQRKKIDDDIAEFLAKGNQIVVVDHTANRAAQDKTTLNRYQNQKAKNKITWAMDREAEINKKK